MSNPITCDLERIEQFLAQGLSDAEQSAFETHLDDCGECRRRLEEAAAGADVWSGVRESLSDEPDSWELCATTAFDSSASEECGVSHEAVLRMLSPTDDERMLGRLGTYEVVGVVGSGGMGVVLKAYDAALNRYVAVKVLAPHLGSSGAARKRFSREARAAAAVVHENVIEVHGVWDTEGLPYLVMPYLRGPSLQRRLDEEGPLETAEILRIGMQAAAGLSAAHAQGLVHRDVKPANILLADGVERVKLTDFGLARAADDASLTKSGIIAGTPQYMSPEQARGESVDQRSDLFSLGCVLYAMCTGRPPFRAETSYGVLRRITDEEPRPIREINPEIPEWLCRIVGRLMSKEPGDRYGSAEEVAELLEACLAHVQQPTVVPLPESLAVSSGGRGFFAFSRWWLGLLAAGGIGVLGMLLWQATAPPDISGTWTSEEWGNVVLEPSAAGRYAGTYTNTLHKVADDKGVPFHLFKNHNCIDCHTGTVLGRQIDGDCPRESLEGKIELKWSRVERRYNGTWSAGDKSGGRISVRMVDGEIRGGWTTSKKSEVKGETPRLGDLLWVRAKKASAGKAEKAVVGKSEQDDSPDIVLDKSKLPRVAGDYHSATTVSGDLITGGGIIERIEDGTLHLRSGDRVSLKEDTVVVVVKPKLKEIPARLLRPGMAIGYSLRKGEVEKLYLVGIVAKPPPAVSAFDTITKLQLRKLNSTSSGIDTRFAMRITGKDGEVSIKAGETKLIPLPKLQEKVEWRLGNYRPEEIDDLEPFDYVLVEWHKNGRVTWTCYTSVKKPAADEDGDDSPAAKALTPVEKLIAAMQGEWVVETMMDGDSDNLEKCADRQCTLTVKGKVLTYRYQRSYGDRASAMLSMSLKWKDDSVPKEVEITVDPNGINREMPGIIECDGKVLKFCISDGLPDGARPRIMASGEKVFYVVCRRKNNGTGNLESRAAVSPDERGAGGGSTVAGTTTTSVEKLIAEMQGEWVAETMKWGADDSLAEMVDRRCEVSVKKKLLTLRFRSTDAPKSLQSSSMGLEWPNAGNSKAVDFIWEPNGDETKLPGIVECDGRVLRICLGLDPDNSKRPRYMIAGEEVLFLECRRNSGEAAKNPGQSSNSAAAVGKTAAELTPPSQDRESNERPTRPIFRGRNPKTGEVELNPAWADPVRRMLARAAVIEVTGDGERISCEIPGGGRGEKAAQLIGAVVVLAADGSVGWKTRDQRIFLIRANRQRVKVAESLLPAVLYALAHPESIERSKEKEAAKLPEGDPRALRADAERIRKMLLENLLSPLCFLYGPAGSIWERTMSMEEEADLRIRSQELAAEAAERQSEGKLKEAKSLKDESERLIVMADAVVVERDRQQEQHNREEQARDEAKQMAARILALNEEGRTSEAAELQLKLNAQLRHMDPDRFRLFDLGERIVDARTRGRQKEANQLEAERDALRKTLAERYPGTDYSAASAGDEAPEGGAASSSAAGVVERLAVARTKERIHTIACSHDGKLIAVANGSPTLILQVDGGSRVKGDWRPSVQILDAISGKVVSELVVTTDEEEGVIDATKWVSHIEVTALAFSSKVNVVAVGTSIGQVKVFDALTGQLYQTLDDERARVGDAETPENWKAVKRGLGRVRSLAFSPDGHLLAACGESFAEFSDVFDGVDSLGEAGTGPGRLKVWEMPAGTLRHDLAGHSHANAVVFSPDGKRLASAGRWSDVRQDGSGVIVWDPKSGKKLRSIANNDNGGTWAVAFSPDSRLVAIGSLSFDKDDAKDFRTTAVSVVHVATGIVEWRRAFAGWAKPGGFSPDGQNVAVLTGGKRLLFLDTETGATTAMVPLTGENAFWNDIAISASGGRLVMGGRAGQSGGVVSVFGFGGGI